MAVSLAVPVLAAPVALTEEDTTTSEPITPEVPTEEPEEPAEPETPEEPEEPTEEEPGEEEEAAEDTLVLEETNCTARIGQYQTLSLTAPAAAVKNGETDVSAQYTFTYAWMDQDRKPLSEEISAQVTSAFQGCLLFSSSLFLRRTVPSMVGVEKVMLSPLVARFVSGIPNLTRYSQK